MNDIWRMTATEVASLVRAKKISAREAMASALARLEQVNPLINAVVDYRPEYSLAQADAVDAAIARGEMPGPLTGVPITIKVLTDQAGFATTNGLTLQRDLIARTNSPMVDNFLKAGATIVGRTNTPAFSYRWFTNNKLHGHTKNPRNNCAHAGRLLRWRVGGDRRRYRSHRPRHGHRGLGALSGLCGRHPWAAPYARPRAELQRIGPGALDRLADHGGVGTACAHDRRLAPRAGGDGRAARARCA